MTDASYYVSRQASEPFLSNGRPLEPGTTVTLNKDLVASNKQLIEGGTLLKVQARKDKEGGN